jgi:hypothetical protein
LPGRQKRERSKGQSRDEAGQPVVVPASKRWRQAWSVRGSCVLAGSSRAQALALGGAH